MAKTQLPRVVLVGRMNVGKSELFNRLSTSVKSLAFDYEGVTRDFVTDQVCWQDACFELVDSGGITFKKNKEELADRVTELVRKLVNTADVVVFVVDVTVGLTQEDREIAKFLHKQGVSTFVVANKADNPELEQNLYEFAQFGFGEPIGISALHGRGIAELLERIVTEVQDKPIKPKQEDVSYKLVLLGKPNVGKSSLMNQLLGSERTIVSDIPGTTREAVSDELKFFSETIQLTDTAGVRRKRSVDEPLEKLMVKSSLRAIERADLVLLLIDGSEKRLSDQELKLAFYAFEQGKSLVLLVNKSDLVEAQDMAEWEFNTEPYEFFLKKIPVLFISCKTGKNVNKILPLVAKVRERSQQEFNQARLRQFFIDAMHRRPLYHSGQLLHVRNVEQIKTNPITILMKVNQPSWFGPSQLGYFENALRSEYDLKGVPVLFVTRK